MKLAVVSKERIQFLRELCNEFTEAIEVYEDSDKGEEDMQKLISVVIGLKNIPGAIRHVVLAYQTVFAHAFDESLSTIEFKPNIKAFLEGK